MEVLELKPIKNKNITLYLIDKRSINPKLNDIEILKDLVKNHDVRFITVEINNEKFKKFKNSSLSIVLDAVNLEYHLLDMPEYAYGYLLDEINKKEEQIRDLLTEYRVMDDQSSFKGLNLKSWIDILKKEVNHDKNILESKTRPKWIVKKILDLARLHENEGFSVIHFYNEKTLSEITKQLTELHIEVVIHELNNFHNIPYLIIKQEENN
ncbi:MAG: hypothetical protein ACFFE5_04440 [Candidatus Thorarchaeota archaeon]